MFKLDSIGKDPYVAAEPIAEQSFIEYAIFVGCLLLDVCKSLGLTILLIIKTFFNLFKSSHPKSIESQLALVTGGANGLGRLIAMRLAAEKCNVVIADMDYAGGKRTAKEIHDKYGVHCESFCIDMSDYEAVEKLHNKIRTDVGIVDILINNVGIIPMMSLREKHWTDLDRILRININPHIWVLSFIFQYNVHNFFECFH